MPKHRVLMEFAAMPGSASTAGSDSGWTESFYDGTDSTDEVADTNARNLVYHRRGCLTSGWRVSAIRLSRLDNANNLLRKGRLIQLAPGQGQGLAGLAVPVPDEQPWDAINLSIATVGGSRRAYLMRGIGVGVVGASGIYLAPPAFVADSANYASALAGTLVAGDWANRLTTAFSLRTRATPAVTSISGVFTAPVANVNLITDQTKPMIRVPANTVQAGMQVSIVGVVDMPGMNGQWKVTGVAADPLNATFAYAVLAQRRRVQIKSPYTQGGQVTYWLWALDPITGFTIGNGASRKTGRPPQQRRGRRSSRRS